MLQRLPVALAQIKAGNTTANLLTEIRQIINSLYQEKEVTKKHITMYSRKIKRIWIQESHETEWILYLWILKIVGYLMLIDYYSVLQIKQT